MNNNRTINNPGYLSAVSSDYDEPIFFNGENGNGNGNDNDNYNNLVRNEYNTLSARSTRRRSSEHYGFAPEKPIISSNTNSYYYPEVINKLDLMLPPNWFECLDPESGKLFYACSKNKTTQWLHPCIPIGTLMPNGIPYGWDVAYEKTTGMRYWINHVEGYNTFVNPFNKK
jgi:hypothetical protein